MELEDKKTSAEKKQHSALYPPDKREMGKKTCSEAEIDEQIQGIEAYLRARDGLADLPELPREALRELIAIRKNSSVQDIALLEERVLNKLRHRYGNFDEGNLVLFLVKYLL